MSRIEYSRNGLTDDDAQQQLTQYGINALPVKKPPTLWGILLHQILNPLIFILIAAAGASVAIGKITDAVFILLVIVLNSGLGVHNRRIIDLSRIVWYYLTIISSILINHVKQMVQRSAFFRHWRRNGSPECFHFCP